MVLKRLVRVVGAGAVLLAARGAPASEASAPPMIVSPSADVVVVATSDSGAEVHVPLEATSSSGAPVYMSAYVYDGDAYVHYSATAAVPGGTTVASADYVVNLAVGTHVGYLAAWTDAPLSTVIRWFNVVVEPPPTVSVTYPGDVRVVASQPGGAPLSLAFQATFPEGEVGYVTAYVYDGTSGPSFDTFTAAASGPTTGVSTYRTTLPIGTHWGYVQAWTLDPLEVDMHWFQVHVEAAATPTSQVSVAHQVSIVVENAPAGGAPVTLTFETTESAGQSAMISAYVYGGDGGVLYESYAAASPDPTTGVAEYTAHFPLGTHVGYYYAWNATFTSYDFRWFDVTVNPKP